MGFSLKGALTGGLLAGGAGALMGGAGGGLFGSQPTQQTTTQVNDPWSGIQPFLNGPGGIYPAAQQLYQSNAPTVAGFSPEQEAAFGLQTQRALSGSPLNFAAQQQNLSTINGDYLYGNPGFNAAYQAAANKIIPQVDSAFASGGRYGSGLAETAKAGALGDAFAGLYNAERGRQQNAVSMAPNLAAQDYFDYSQLADVGAQRQALAQQQLDSPFTRLQRYASVIQPGAGIGGTSTQTSPLYKNRLSGALGGALVGSQVGGPWGALIGGGLGLLA